MDGKPFDGLGYTGGLRRGYTTGTCAAAAAKGAARMFLSGAPCPLSRSPFQEGSPSPFPLRSAPFRKSSPGAPSGRTRATTPTAPPACSSLPKPVRLPARE